MAKKIIVLPFFVAFLLSSSFAQKTNDPILFTVEDANVRVSEFDYIYSKTNGEEANYSKSSLQEYLDLYTKFKLKVQKAKDMQLDTITSLQQELEGYRKQLADSYLLDREVTDKLVKEAYERKKQDVEMSHILISVGQNATAQEETAAQQRLVDLKKQMEGGTSFQDLAKQYSDDGTSKNNGGKVGFLTAVLPNGFYDLETALYTLPVGTVSDPIRTNFGYHLVKVDSRRPARGEMEIAHILVRTPKNAANDDQSKGLIDKVYAQLKDGANFNELVKQYSQDKATSNRDGYLGFFGINQYERAFEDAAFALTEDESFSEPVKTNEGWHIIKRISKRELAPYNLAKAQLEQKIRQDGRFELARMALVEKIKTDNSFTQTTADLKTLKDTLSEDFLTFRWRAPEEKPTSILFSFGDDKKVNLGAFMDYMQQSARERIQLGRKNDNIAAVVDALYDNFVAAEALKYEEGQLEEKYPDFKALMREYQEGILLFEATKMLVWDKASQDTTGLKKFFKTVDGKYKWEERAVVTTYNVNSSGIVKLEEMRNYAQGHTMEEVLTKFNKNGELLTASQKTIEKGRDQMMDRLEWKVGTISDNESNKQNKSISFTKFEEIIPSTPKTLKEARGYVVADYQDFLEKQWVEQLRNEYNVKLNKRVFNRMVKK